jgi:putative FmdB family regulatory protein
MPLYEYECEACGERFELIRKFSDPPVEVCGRCGKGPVNRLQSSPAIQFKGSGWYITDYAQKGKSDGGSQAGKGEKSGSADATSSETSKPDASGDAGSKTGASTPAAPVKTGGTKD